MKACGKDYNSFGNNYFPIYLIILRMLCISKTFRVQQLLYLAVLLFITLPVFSQQSLQGKVVDSAGNPVPGATVRIKNSKATAVTNNEGSFTIKGAVNSVLIVSSIGYAEQEVAAGSQSDITITLSLSSATLNEVVVTALGVRREKRNLTYSTQQVNSDEITKAQEPNVLNTISGKVAGVQITSTTGAPGSASSIIVRGITSLTGDNQALIVIDGVPMNNDETDGGGDGGAGTNRLADIDPGIIENINILKGGAATALYGSAGARGVVLITTKNGNGNRKPAVTLSSSVSVEDAILPPRQMTYAQGSDGIYYDGETVKTSTSWGPRIDTLYDDDGNKVPFYNQLKLFFKTGVTNNNSVSVSGGNNTSDYFASYSYFNQTGTVPNTSLDRHTMFTKFRSQIFDKLSLSAQLNYSYSKDLSSNQGYGLQNPLVTTYIAPISYNMLPYLEEDGSQRLYRYSRDNPYWVLDNVLNTSVVNRFLPQITLNYDATDWLTITERLGADIYADQYNYHVNIGDISYTTGRLISNNQNFRQFNHDLIVQAKKQFGQFNATLLVGNNVFSQHWDQMYAVGTGLAQSGYYNMASASTVTYDESQTLRRKVGFYAQAEVDYDKYLVLSLTGRIDRSSVLALDNGFYPYGSAALGFIFSELLNENVKKVINFGKARISYASVGNDNVGPYANSTPYYQAYTNVSFPYSGQNGFLISSSLGNPNLKNELQKEFEVGLEAKFLNSRLGFEASYYVRNMADLLLENITLPYSTGYGSTTINSGKVRSKGLEILLTATPVKTKNFSWDVTINYSKINTRVLKIATDLPQTSIGFTYIKEGSPYGMLYGTKYARDDNGNILVDDNGLPYAADDQGFLGSAMPDWIGGIINQFRYKNLSLSFQIDTRQGGKLQNVDEYYNLFYGVSKITEKRDDFVVPGIVASTGKENDIVVDAQTYFQTISYITEPQIQDASFIKLRNVSLSYAFNNSPFLKKIFKEANLTLTGRNLWIHKAANFTGSDPESNNTFGTSNGALGVYTFGTPTSRSYGCSLKLTF
ncbi:SusC/RagA family TonB-linked outer membrane protein [Parafilimonas sp.]|uniref:SusC/RagA family TonB-linked outer membrane protein n=1 Tax=Parafilimonas sp. TaxID=1969739 RepID=UPI0039E44295